MSNRYTNIQVIKNSLGKRYYVPNIYPDIPVTENDIYVITTAGDRLDLIANDTYGDPALYWIIASANNLPGDSLVPPLGQQLRIPIDVETILNEYIRLNENP
jgi:hypothetical protein